MAGIDLREIRFRAFEEGDESAVPSLSPLAAGSTYRISLAGIKFRANDSVAEESDSDTAT